MAAITDLSLRTDCADAGEVTRRLSGSPGRHRCGVAHLAPAASTDDLTGLGDRRLGTQLLDDLAPGDALAVIDLDRLHMVNETFGGHRGDQVLQVLGDFLRRELPAAQAIALIDGQKFLIVLRGDDAVDGDLTVERLVRDWHDTRPLATLSAGVVFHIRGQSSSMTRAFADSALDAAKTAGRDRMVLAASYWRP